MGTQSAMRPLRSFLLIMIAAAVLAYSSFENCKMRRQEAIETLNQTLICKRQASEIKEIRSRPVFAVSTMEDVGDLTSRIAAARDSAGLTDQAIDLVDPQSPTRIADSPYRLRPVAIDLRGLELSQVVRFVDALSDREKGMWVNEIRMTPMRRQQSENEPERWNVELVLTQVNYSPTTRK